MKIATFLISKMAFRSLLNFVGISDCRKFRQKNVYNIDYWSTRRLFIVVVTFDLLRQWIVGFVAMTPSDNVDDVAVDVGDFVVGSHRSLDGLNDLDGGSTAHEAGHVT